MSQLLALSEGWLDDTTGMPELGATTSTAPGLDVRLVELPLSQDYRNWAFTKISLTPAEVASLREVAEREPHIREILDRFRPFVQVEVTE